MSPFYVCFIGLFFKYFSLIVLLLTISMTSGGQNIQLPLNELCLYSSMHSEDENLLLIPKSQYFSWFYSQSRIFAGFISLSMIPFRCRKLIPSTSQPAYSKNCFSEMIFSENSFSIRSSSDIIALSITMKNTFSLVKYCMSFMTLFPFAYFMFSASYLASLSTFAFWSVAPYESSEIAFTASFRF